MINKLFFLIISFSFIEYYSIAQLPNPVLVGYFHNWNDVNAPYIQLDQIDPRYNVVDVAFAVPQPGTDYKMEFIPDQVSQSTFISQMQTLQSQGKKVLISIGGATAPVVLDNISERDTFVSTMMAIIDTFGFDGIDIDLEGSSVMVSGGTISAPVDSSIVNLIGGIKQIMGNYHQQHNQKLILTMAPETAGVQGGMSAYTGIWGAYLPVIHALRDSLDLLHVQLYNSGSMYGIDANIYSQGTAEFIVAMCEAVIEGFSTSGGIFIGLPASKVAVGLPACSIAAGGGYIDTTTVAQAIKYLMGNGPQTGPYQLFNPVGYPTLKGMMTWSINWDAVSTCGSVYEYAENYDHIFGTTTSVALLNTSGNDFCVYPNPVHDKLYIWSSNQNEKNTSIQLCNFLGETILYKNLDGNYLELSTIHLPIGVYYLKCNNIVQKIIKQ